MTDASLARLRTATLIAAGAGAVGSIAFMLIAGHPPLFLRVLFAIWVLGPFVVFLGADRVSKRWSVLTRATLYGVTLLITLVSLVTYGYVALGPPKGAFAFVVIPPASCVLMAIAIAIAAMISGRQSH